MADGRSAEAETNATTNSANESYKLVFRDFTQSIFPLSTSENNLIKEAQEAANKNLQERARADKKAEAQKEEAAHNAKLVTSETAAVTEHFRKGEVFKAQMRLAEDYLTSAPEVFKEIAKGLQTSTAKFKNEVYVEDLTSNFPQIKIDDGYITDTTILGINSKCNPRSKSLDSEKLEQAARRFNDMLKSHTTSERETQVWADEAAARALVNFAQKLPKTEAAQLMMRAAEINQELGRTWLPTLRVSMADLDGDGIPMELKQVDLLVPYQCRMFDYHLGTVPIFKAR